jgi:hypothetical protein
LPRINPETRQFSAIFGMRTGCPHQRKPGSPARSHCRDPMLENARHGQLRQLLLISLLVTPHAHAQLNGQNVRGDIGVGAGSLPETGWSVNAFYSFYRVNKIRDSSGNGILRGTRSASDNAALTLQWVSERKILGGNYSFLISPGWATSSLDSPTQRDHVTRWGPADLYVQPVALGWNTDRADYTAGVGVYAPTGRYDAEADDNTGMGAWTLELSTGSTFYLDPARTWSLAMIAFWETFSSIEGSEQEIGDIFTIEGGLGKAIGSDWNAGLAWFGQWKMTADDLDIDERLPFTVKKHRIYGLGPEVNWTLHRGGDEFAAFNLRYVKDFGARSMTEGEILTLSLTVPF